jgi:hypothetical protein
MILELHFGNNISQIFVEVDGSPVTYITYTRYFYLHIAVFVEEGET